MARENNSVLLPSKNSVKLSIWNSLVLGLLLQMFLRTLLGMVQFIHPGLRSSLLKLLSDLDRHACLLSGTWLSCGGDLFGMPAHQMGRAPGWLGESPWAYGIWKLTIVLLFHFHPGGLCKFGLCSVPGQTAFMVIDWHSSWLGPPSINYHQGPPTDRFLSVGWEWHTAPMWESHLKRNLLLQQLWVFLPCSDR